MNALVTAILVGCLSTLTGAQQVTVPASADTLDGDASTLLPGSGDDSRWQLVLDAAVIPAASIGQMFTGITFRRDQASIPERGGGTANVTITISHAAHSAAGVSSVFDDNHDAITTNRVVVYQGPWIIPFTSSTASRTVSWQNAEDIVGVSFTTPFAYAGGPLCVEITSHLVAGDESRNWPMDALQDPVSGTVVRIGESCGPHTVAAPGTQHASALLSPRELVAGGTASFVTLGETGNFTALAIGFTALDVDLAAVGIGAPECRLRLDPVVSLMTTLGTAAPLTGGHARIDVFLQNSPSTLGVPFLAQFLEFSFPITASEALQCTISSGAPTVGGSVISAPLDSGVAPSVGRVTNGVLPVLRFGL